MTPTTTQSPPSFLPKFLPGLLLGTVVGSLAAAFLTPIVHTWLTLPPDPIARSLRVTESPPEVACAIENTENLEGR